MSRPLRARALVPLTLLVAAGCQNYNFNPVGHCLVQPGTERFTLSDISSADVLFVVDDSGSMAAEQAKLAANFGRFIDNLDRTNAARAQNGLDPIDFHIAVTTTSVFWNPVASTCSKTCGTSSGTLVCCNGSTPVVRPKACSAPTDSCPGGAACRATCSGFKGEYRCCNTNDAMNLAATEPLACGAEGAACGDLQHHYDFAGCGGPTSPTAGVAADQYPYPQGDFVSWNANPRVLHFDKQLYPMPPAPGDPAPPTPKNRQGFTREQLIASFVGGAGLGGTVSGNVVVGTCGSGQEQALQAARLALQKALAKQQKDTYDLTGKLSWSAADRTASAAADWPRDKSKLVLVFVGDEDDCSSTDDPAKGVVMSQFTTGDDSCVRDGNLPADQQKRFQVQEIVDYFASLGRPLGAAFIASASQTTCGRPLAASEQAACSSYAATCTPGVCVQENCPTAGVCSATTSGDFCGGQAAGFRLFGAADALRAKGADVVEGSVCDSNFGEILNQVAEIVKPPSGLVLPTLPADGKITLLRIAQSNGETRSLCTGPAPAGTTGDALNQYDWWFTASRDGIGGPVALSQYVFINHATAHCEANPGETYSADYIARQPAGGCSTRTDCSTTLGGSASDWGCYAAGTAQSTCICCTAGSTDPACQP